MLAILKTVFGNEWGIPSLISQCQFFFRFCGFAGEMVGQGCSLLGFVGGTTPALILATGSAVARRQLAILFQNPNQHRSI